MSSLRPHEMFKTFKLWQANERRAEHDFSQNINYIFGDMLYQDTKRQLAKNE